MAQWDMLHPAQQLKTIFRYDNSVKVVTAFNKGEAITRAQKGGAALIMFDCMATLATKPRSGTLGCWYWITFKGKHESATQLMVAYIPCKSKNTRLKAIYCQQRRHF